MSEEQQQPTARGRLAETPFAHLVLYLYQHRSSGTLVVTRAAAESAAPSAPVSVLFARGRAIAARVPERVDSLDGTLLPLCAVADAGFEFYDGDLVGSGAEVMTGMFDPYAFVAESARSHFRQDVIDGVLARYGDSLLRLQAATDLARFRFNANESKMVELLKAAPSNIDGLCSQSELSVADARRLCYVLVITKAVAPYESSEHDSSSSQVRERVSSVGPAKEPSQPPRPSVPQTPLPQHGSQPARPHPPAGAVAWQTIASRAAAASLRPPTVDPKRNTPRPSMAPVEALDAAGRFRRVEQLVLRQAYQEAMPLIRALCDEDPKSAKYWGMFGLVRLSRSSDTAALKDVIDAVNQALRLDEDEPRALYTKALCYKRMGKEREALHYFKRTVSVEPGNIDAAREVRLASVRTADDKKPKR